MGADILGWRELGAVGSCRPTAIFSRAIGALSLCDRAVAEQGVEALDVRLSQRCRGGLDDVIDGAQMVICLDEIIYLDRLEAHLDLAGLVDVLHLLPHKAVAGHSVGTVAEVDLYVVVQPVIDAFGFLLHESLDHRRQLFDLRLFLRRLFGVGGEEPSLALPNRIGNPTVAAIPSDHWFGYFPFGSGFF